MARKIRIYPIVRTIRRAQIRKSHKKAMKLLPTPAPVHNDIDVSDPPPRKRGLGKVNIDTSDLREFVKRGQKAQKAIDALGAGRPVHNDAVVSDPPRPGRPRKAVNGETTPISIGRFSLDLYQQAKVAAIAEGKTIREWAEDAFREKLERER